MEYVIMPNHMHGIIKIIGADTIRPYNGMLSKVMKWFKQKVSKEIHKMWYEGFQRQKSFYDCVILDEKSLQRVQEYICNNPLKWDHDKYYDD